MSFIEGTDNIRYGDARAVPSARTSAVNAAARRSLLPCILLLAASPTNQYFL